MLYGSELIPDLPVTATRFFADYPTGFRVFPVGAEGGSALKGRPRTQTSMVDLSGFFVAEKVAQHDMTYAK